MINTVFPILYVFIGNTIMSFLCILVVCFYTFMYTICTQNQYRAMSVECFPLKLTEIIPSNSFSKLQLK